MPASIGGTKIAAAVLDSSMTMLSVHAAKEHAGQIPDQGVDAIERAHLGALSRARMVSGEVAGVDLSFAGHTDGLHGTVLTSSNMPEWGRGSRCAISSPRGSISM
jgi:predicted NBD/HSP70 family sugar kinase